MTSKYRRLLVSAFALAAFAAGCGAGMNPSSKVAVVSRSAVAQSYCATATAPPYPPSLSRAHSTSGSLKAPIAGLLDLGQTNFSYASPPPNTLYYACKVDQTISGLVINDDWADLQPTASGTLDTRNIDAALAVVAAYNKGAANPIRARLRIMAGIDAPQWAKELGGPIQLCDPFGGVPTPSPTPPGATPTPSPAMPTPCPSALPLTDVRTVGAFWTPGYQKAWSNMQHRLAARYDANPLVAEVSVTSCTAGGDEEFYSPIDQWTLAKLAAAGYSNSAFQRCLAHALDAYGGWHRTIVDDIVNPFYLTNAGGINPRLTWDFAFTKKMMLLCVSSLGPRCMLDNQEIGKYSPPPASPSPPPNVRYLFAMWQYMQQLHAQGVLITLQTASPGNLLHTWGSNVAGWNSAVALARRYGASSLELWPPEVSSLSSPAPSGTPIPCSYPGHPEYTGYTCFPAKTLSRWSQSLSP